MKNLVILFTLFLLFSACKKPETNITSKNGSITSTSHFVISKINGIWWNCDSLDAFLRIDTPAQYRIFGITCFAADKIIDFALVDTIVSTIIPYSTFSLPQESIFQYISIVGNDSIPYDNVLWGNLTINAQDTATKRISGTFSFHVTSNFVSDTISVTEGEFTNIPYSIWH